MEKFIIPILWVVTVLAAVASIAFTLVLVLSQSDLPAMQAIFGCTGFAFELLKLVGLSLVFLFHRRGYTGLTFIATPLVIALSVFSLIGTSGALKSNSADKEHVHRIQSGEYQNIQSQISQLDQQIESTRTAAMVLPQNYYTKRQNMLSEVDRMLESRQELATALPTMEVGAVGYSAYYASLGQIFGTTAEAMQISVYLFIAFLLEAITLTAPLFVTALMVKKELQPGETDYSEYEPQQQPHHNGASHQHSRFSATNPVRRTSYGDSGESRPPQRRDGHQNNVAPVESGNIAASGQKNGGGSRPPLWRDDRIQARYIELLWELRDERQEATGQLAGRRRIADHLRDTDGFSGVDRNVVDNIHKGLKKSGLVISKNKATYPVKSKVEMLATLGIDSGGNIPADVARYILTVGALLLLGPSVGLGDTVAATPVDSAIGWFVCFGIFVFCPIYFLWALFTGKPEPEQKPEPEPKETVPVESLRASDYEAFQQWQQFQRWQNGRQS